MTRAQKVFIDSVMRSTDQHFANVRGTGALTTYEAEAATLCAILSTMGKFDCDPKHVDKILEAVQAFVMRLRNGHEGAFQLLLLRLSELQLERAQEVPL